MMILFTSHNIASANIARALIQENGFEPAGEGEWTRGEARLIDTRAPSVLEVPADLDTDYAIVLSTHRSRIQEKIMTAHFPGNWSAADMGGEPRTLNTAHASRLKTLLLGIKKEADGIGWKTSLEADHHGPTGKTPLIFAEIGSTEEEWKDWRAAQGMARAIAASIGRVERYESFFGIGGGHYPKTFNRMVLDGPLAIGHIAPKYVIDAMDEEMFRQGVERNVERISKVIVAKDETNLAQKEKIKGLAERSGIPCELV